MCTTLWSSAKDSDVHRLQMENCSPGPAAAPQDSELSLLLLHCPGGLCREGFSALLCFLRSLKYRK